MAAPTFVTSYSSGYAAATTPQTVSVTTQADATAIHANLAIILRNNISTYGDIQTSL